MRPCCWCCDFGCDWFLCDSCCGWLAGLAVLRLCVCVLVVDLFVLGVFCWFADSDSIPIGFRGVLICLILLFSVN